MSFITTFVHSPIAGALGWTMLHSLWQGTAIAAALGLTLLFARASRTRYALSALALASIVTAMVWTLATEWPTATAGASSQFPVVMIEARPAPIGEAAGPIRFWLAIVAPWLAPFWAIGASFTTGLYVAGSLTASRMRRRGVCAPPEYWAGKLTLLARRLEVRRTVALLESSLASVPVVVGHLRPMILMPAGLLTGMDPSQVEAVLLHELAHVARADYLGNVLQRLIEALMFYHPAVWWISHRMRIERENCCDDAVISAGTPAREYATALAVLEQFRGTGTLAAPAATGGNLVKRMQRLLLPPSPRSGWPAAAAAVILAGVGAVSVAAWQSGAAASPQQARPSDRSALSRYDRWLNQDVVYIIDDRERAAFEKLSSDAERDKFIEQFWLRRDPTPGTPGNEFKQEHYRRIAYANQRFGTLTGLEGWRTDRGRYYIVYGPPDELESHPNGGGTIPYPYESWLWHHIPGVGDNVALNFVDRTHTRDYRVVPAPVR